MRTRNLSKKPRRSAGRLSVLIAIAVAVPGLLFATALPSFADGGPAQLVKYDVYLSSGASDGGVACGYRNIYLSSGNYLWDATAANVSEGFYSFGSRHIWLTGGRYNWYSCVHGVAGQAGVYYASASLQGNWSGAGPAAYLGGNQVRIPHSQRVNLIGDLSQDSA